MDFMAALKEDLEAARGSDYHLDAVAAEFCARMSSNHHDEWISFLLDRAPIFMRRELSRLESSERTTARTRGKQRAFRQAVDDGDVGQFLAAAYVVDDENTRRTMAEMTGKDHTYVASRYEATGKEALMMAAFHRVIAKKVGGRKTSEVLSEEQIQALWQRGEGRAA